MRGFVEKQRTKEDQAAFDRLLNNLSCGDRSLGFGERKKKPLEIKGLHCKRNKGKR